MSKFYPLHLTSLWLGAVLLLGLFSIPSTVLFAQGATQITNTAGNPPPAMSDPADFKAFNGRLYFSAKSGPLNYRQLFSTDGTAAGTRLERRSSATPLEGVDPKNLTVFRGRLYFSAQTSNSERELWVTDGTPEGTVLFKEIQPSNGSGNPIQITATDDKLYFTAVNNLAQELWVSDGTPAGTRRLADVVGVPVGSTDPTELTAVGNRLFYKTKVAPNTTYVSLWVTDGTAAGTRRVRGDVPPIGPDPNNVSFSLLTHFKAFNGKLIFRAWCACTDEEPWISDGTPEGTVGLNLHPTSGVFIGAQSKFQGFTIHNNRAYFYANNPRDGLGGLWVTDGTLTGSTFLKTVSKFEGATSYNEKLYFTASTDEIWETDGTVNGTRLAVTIDSRNLPPDIKNLVVANGKLYFTTQPEFGGSGYGLWETDGTQNGTRRVIGATELLLSRVRTLLGFNDQLFLTGLPPSSPTTPELFRLNTTPINRPPTPPVIADQTTTVNQPFVFTIPAFIDPDEILYDNEEKFVAYQVTGYPAGFSYFPIPYSGGQISGQTPLAGRYTITVTGTDRYGASASTTFLLIVNPATGTPQPGSPLQLLAPTYNCVTGAITFNTQGGDGSPISYSAPGISRASVTANYGIVEVGLRNDPKPILLQATQNGSTASYTFDLPNACGGGSTPEPPSSESLQLLPPTYDCVTGVIRFNSRGGDGSLITYSAPGVSRGAATDAIGVVELELRKDPKPIVLQATQNGSTVSYTFDLPDFCGSARLAARESGLDLSVKVFGNPVVSETAQVEISGAEGQALRLLVTDLQGHSVSDQLIDRATASEIRSVRIGKAMGLYLLRVSSSTQSKTIKLLRQ